MLSATEPTIHADCFIENVTFGRFVEIGRQSVVMNSEIGDYSYCSRLCDLANVTIGKFSNIASNVRIGATDHPMEKASLHHFLYRSEMYWDDTSRDAPWFEKRRARRATIGHDTWIGHAAMVKPDVTVGNGAIVGAGAVVTRDVAPYTIVAGNPARVIRPRYSDPQTPDRLETLAWWNWPHDQLRAALDDFRSLTAEAFLDKYETP